MANEKRLIDANARIEEIKKAHCTKCENYNGIKCRACWVDDAIGLIDDAPTVDAVEVVRCEKCLYRSQYANKNGMYKCGGILTEDGDCFLMVKPDHFCAFGKQRGKDGGNENG